VHYVGHYTISVCKYVQTEPKIKCTVCYVVERSLCFALYCQGQPSSPGEHFRISFYQETEQDRFSAQLETKQLHTLYHRTYISESTY
jgi:hypothetical protein